MSSGYGRFVAALGGLVAALSLIAAAPSEGNPKRDAQSQYAAASTGQGRQESLSGSDREGLAVSREANRIAERANLIAEAQEAYALGQLVLGGIGVGLTAVAAGAAIFAAIYAKAAADAARDSATADNAALEEARLASKAARADAIEQAKRFTDQLNIASQTASAMREAAIQASAANSISIDNAKKQLRPYLIAERAQINWLEKTAIFTVSFSNSGTTPVVHLMSGAYTIIDLMGHLATHNVDRVKIPLGNWGPVGAQSEREVVILTAASTNINRSTINGQTPLGLFGYVKYYDVFDNEYETEFAFFMLSSDPAGGRMALIPGRRPAFRENGTSNQ